MQKYYANAAKSVINDFINTYNHLLNSIEDGRQPTPADLYKLEKYWEMQGNLRKSLNSLGEKEIEALTKIFEANFLDIYNGLDLPTDAMFSNLSEDTVQHLINSVWCADGKSWSSRVWDNTSNLAEALNEELINTLLTGKKTTYLKDRLQEQFNVSYSEANRLVRTELAHIQTVAAEQRYKNCGIEWAQVWADKDERQCDICGKLHKTKYRIGEKMPIPAHPNCRCCIVPVVENRLTSIFKDDIMIGKSLGAAARNYPIKAPDSKQHYKFAEGTSITKIKVIMGKGTKRELKEKYNIAIRNGINNPDDIQKLRGEGFVIAEGKKRKAELHWYQANGENYEFKIKRYLDES